MQSIAQSLFLGEVFEDEVFPYPEMSAEDLELTGDFVDAFQKFASDCVNSEEFDKNQEIPKDVIEGLKELGMFGMAVEEEYDGLGLGASAYARIYSDIAQADGSLAVFLGAHQSIGFKALQNEGTEEQKKKWLPELVTGERIAAFCLTEPSSGSDAFSIKTKAVDNGDGTYTINGQKLWITNAGTANFYTVFAKTKIVIDGEEKERISCFIVEGEREGITFGEKEQKLGIRASETRAVYFDNVIIPKENLIGELGNGFKIALNVLNSGRLSLASACAGVNQMLVKMATQQAKGRSQFGMPISDFGIIQEKLAFIQARAFTAESMTFLTTGSVDKGMKDYAVEAAICKIFCSEALWESADTALQIAGGNGYMREYPYERILRDARINMIFEGTNEILRCLVALTGMKSPGEELRKLGKVTDLSKALNDPFKSLGVLTDFAKRRLKNMMPSNALTKVHPDFSELAEDFSTFLGSFYLKVESSLMKYGKKIIGQEMIQKRIADMVIELYAMVAILSRGTCLLNKEGLSDEKKAVVKRMVFFSFDLSKKKFIGLLKRMKKNHDKNIEEISKFIVDQEEYGFDILKG